MIICAWCGVECDGSIYFVMNTEILFAGGLSEEEANMAYKVWSRTTDTKRFCSAEHRLAWFTNP